MHTFFRSFKFFLFCVFILFSCKTKDPLSEKSNEKKINSFGFYKAANPTLAQDIFCEIVGDSIFAITFSGTNLKSLKPKFTFDAKEVLVNNSVQVSEKTQQNFEETITYKVISNDGTAKQYFLKFKDTNLPALHISTNNKPITSKETYIEGNLKIKQNISGESLFDGNIEIRGRGNSTWGLAKKPYKIKLSKKAKLLGMNEARQWVLLANHADKSLLRNELGFELSRVLGLAYTPSSRFVDVILNNEYIGNYELVEQIEVSKTRVDLSSPNDPTKEDGFLIEADGFARIEKVNFMTQYRMPISVHYPDDEDITIDQKSQIISFVNKFENSLFKTDFDSPLLGYSQNFDVESYVNFLLVNEIIGNPDLFWSTYFYKKNNDPLLYSGPIWDMDIAGNNDFRQGDTQNKLMLNVGFEPKIWINQLMKDKAFRNKIRKRWNEVKGGKLLALENFINQQALKISQSQKKNFQRWPILNEKIYNNPQALGSFEAEVAFLKNYYLKRIDWLDGQFNGSKFD